MIGIISAVVLVNFALFLLSFLLGTLAFMKKCPVCLCCRRKPKRPKEKLINDPSKKIELSEEEEIIQDKPDEVDEEESEEEESSEEDSSEESDSQELESPDQSKVQITEGGHVPYVDSKKPKKILSGEKNGLA